MARKWHIAAWWSTSVEVSSAIARLRREKVLSKEQFTAAIRLLLAVRPQWQEIVPSDAVRDEAERLLGRHSLRAADSLQLGAALVWCNGRPKGRAFLCADAKLADVAEQEGFRVLRP
jgi:predicted nucleic acid-binding protein